MSCNGSTAHLASLGHLPDLRELSLSGCRMGPDGGAALAPVLRLLDLGLLDLSDCFSPGDFLFGTPNNIPGDPNPRQVTWSDPAFRWWSELTTAIGGIRGLRSSNFSWNGVGIVKPPRPPREDEDQDVIFCSIVLDEIMADLLVELSELEHLDLSGSRSRRYINIAAKVATSLPSLDLSWNMQHLLPPEPHVDVTALVTHLGQLTRLTRLEFSHNHVSGALAVLLAHSLQALGGLQHLDLRSNGICGADLAPALPLLTCLTHLDLGRNQQIYRSRAEDGDFFTGLSLLRRLSYISLKDVGLLFRNAGLGHFGAEDLGPALLHLSGLEKLLLQGNGKLEAAGVAALMPGLMTMPGLRVLELDLHFWGRVAITPLLNMRGTALTFRTNVDDEASSVESGDEFEDEASSQEGSEDEGSEDEEGGDDEEEVMEDG